MNNDSPKDRKQTLQKNIFPMLVSSLSVSTLLEMSAESYCNKIKNIIKKTIFKVTDSSAAKEGEMVVTALPTPITDAS